MRLHNVRVLGADGLEGPYSVDRPTGDAEERDASGLILAPGFVDLHAHLRDPGFPEKETLATGAASAAFGGFTHVVAMANTQPVTDRPEIVRRQVARAEGLPVRVSFAAALTVALEGKELTDAKALRAAGAVALSDDGRHALDRRTLRQALEAAAAADLPVFIHGQKEELGSNPEAETRAVEEALQALREAPAARLHIQHVSTAGAVDLIRQAKQDGLAVTAEATPHHLALSADDASRMGPQGKVSPPLRSKADREALLAGLAEDVIDVIATDHAPHEVAAKAEGANGFHGLETAVGVVFGLGLDQRVIYRALVERPKQILGEREVPVDAWSGEAALEDWLLIDPLLEWTVDPGSFRSRGRNSPFAGRRLRGRVVMTVVGGQVLFERMVQRV
jgi:dihydroorotase